MQFLNLFCPMYPKHGRIWDIAADRFYCSHHQHDEEGTINLWTGNELIKAHHDATIAKQQLQVNTNGSPEAPLT